MQRPFVAWLLFALAALVPIVAVGAVTSRAARAERAAFHEEQERELAQAAALVRPAIVTERERAQTTLRSIESGSVNEVRAALEAHRPAFADSFVLDVEGALAVPLVPARAEEPSAACSAARAALATNAREEARGLILAQCTNLRAPSGRFLWPLLAIEAGKTERLGPWLSDHATLMADKERLALRYRLTRARSAEAENPALAGPPGPLSVIVDVLAEPSTDDRIEAGVRIHEGRSIALTRTLANGARAGYAIHKGSLARATALLPSRMSHLEIVASTDRRAGDVALTPSFAFRVVPRDPIAAEGVLHARQVRIAMGGAFGALLSLALAAVLFARARHAARLAELRTDFVAAVSHELRTPLASVRMLAELLEGGDVSEGERPEIEHTLAGEARRLASTLERMLRFGALARGKLVADRKSVQLADVVNDAAQRFRAAYPDRELLVAEAQPGTSAAADAGLLALALDNLLSNAVKYAPDGGPYRLRAAVDGKHAALTVSDRGPGLDATARARVFLPFERSDDRLSRATEGTGVGLALVRGVARAHGGDATVESEPGAGATFVIRFPVGGPRADK